MGIYVEKNPNGRRTIFSKWNEGAHPHQSTLGLSVCMKSLVKLYMAIVENRSHLVNLYMAIMESQSKERPKRKQ